MDTGKMLKRLSAVAATTCTVAVAGVVLSVPLHAQAPDSVRLMRTLSVLAHDSMEGRATGTPGNAKAQAFLIEELRKRGVKPYGGAYAHPFKMSASRTAGSADSITATNILGVIPGTVDPKSYIVVSAHYDHLGVRNGDIFNGADDNASGTAAILEIASWFAAHPPKRTILIAAFDAEERGLAGARALLRLQKGLADSVLLNVNLDMVGRNTKNELYAAGTNPYPFLLPYVETAASRSRLKLLTGHDVPGSGHDDWTNQSDHGPFHAMKIPFLYFGEEDHPDYHKATDEFSGIMPGFYVNAVRTIIDVISEIDANPPVRVTK